MAFTAKDILSTARIALHDAGNTRWTLDELRTHLNDGLKQIAFLKPTAVSEHKRIALAAGTYQTLPDGEQMLRVIRNITSADGVTPRVAGPIITTIDRGFLDQHIRNWHNASAVPFSAVVIHAMMDEMNPRAFYVFPGNDGTGAIEAIVSTVPAMIAAPASPLDIDSYTAQVDLPDLYENTLRDYVLSRAYEKDAALPAAAQRAQAYRMSFESSLGVKQQIEAVANINTDQ